MSTPICQNDFRLPEPIQRAGCLFRSLSMLAEIRTGRTLSPAQIVEQYKWLVRHEYMNANCYVQDHAAVIRAAQYYLEAPQRAAYVLRQTETGHGDFETDTPNAWIGHVKTEAGNGHFLVVARDGRCIWDPWWPSPMPVKSLSLRGYVL